MKENPNPDYPIEMGVNLSEKILNLCNDYGMKYNSKAIVMDTLIHAITAMTIHLELDKNTIMEALEYSLKVSEENSRFH